MAKHLVSRLIGAFVLLAATSAQGQSLTVRDDAPKNGVENWSWPSGVPGLGFNAAAQQQDGAISSPTVVNLLQIEPNVNVLSMVSDRFTWSDSSNQPRVAVLAHNDGAAGPGGTQGGELREFRYEAGGTRIVAASGSGYSGFGYVVSHPGGTACVGGGDSSGLGHFLAGNFTRVFEGRHHVIFRFTQLYPR